MAKRLLDKLALEREPGLSTAQLMVPHTPLLPCQLHP